jgi:hypothetical protein
VDVAVTAKSDKAPMAGRAVTPSFSEASLELKSTVGHELAGPAASIFLTLREQTHTADAGSALSLATIIDAPLAGNAAAKGGGDLKASDAQAAGMKPEMPEADLKSVELSDKPDEKAIPAADASPVIPDLNKDQARPSDQEKAAVPKPEPAGAAAPRRGAQIAVFVSKKDGKLYVRQNFAPLFDVPVTIAPSDRPLGTHVFTAQTDKDDANQLRWSVVSLPAVARNAARQDDDESVSRRRKTTGAIEVKPVLLPGTAAEALDRLIIPADATARIAELLSTGGSIIVSDQGINTGETGEGTDFIIPLR